MVRAGAWLVAALVLGTTALAQADNASRDQARDAYDLGAAAFKRADWTRAAQEFARADEIAPSDVALESALESAIAADDPLLGAELADRASRRDVSSAVAKLAADARAKFARRTGFVRVECPGQPCVAEVDGRALGSGSSRRLLAGPHAVLFWRGSASESVTVEVLPDRTLDVAPRGDHGTAPRDHATAAPGASRSGISPVWFWVGAAVTTGLGVATGISWSDALRRHDRFDGAGCDRVTVSGCVEASRDGIAAENRTNWLLGGTVASGALTAALATFFVRWGDGPLVSVGSRGETITLAWRTP